MGQVVHPIQDELFQSLPCQDVWLGLHVCLWEFPQFLIDSVGGYSIHLWSDFPIDDKVCTISEVLVQNLLVAVDYGKFVAPCLDGLALKSGPLFLQ